MTDTGVVRRYWGHYIWQIKRHILFFYIVVHYYESYLLFLRFCFIYLQLQFPWPDSGYGCQGCRYGTHLTILIIKLLKTYFLKWHQCQSWSNTCSILVTHLSNQHYSICIRKPAKRSRVCYYPCTVKAISAADESVSFIHHWIVSPNILSFFYYFYIWCYLSY